MRRSGTATMWRTAPAMACGAALLAAAASAQQRSQEPPPPNASLELSEETLNALMARLGSLAGAGIHRSVEALVPVLFEACEPSTSLTCPGSAGGIPLSLCRTADGGAALVPSGTAVPWRWWVSAAHFTLTEGSMAFGATVNSVIGGQTNAETRTVPASIGFDAPSGRLRIQIGTFSVPLEWEGTLVTKVEVARLYGISLPIEPQQLVVPLPTGGTRTLTARAKAAEVQYLPRRVLIRVDVGF